MRFWRTEWASSALAAVREALLVANVPMHEAEPFLLTVKLYPTPKALPSLPSEMILCGKWSGQPKRCWTLVRDRVYVTSAEVELLLAKLPSGALKVRQSVAIEVSQQLQS